MEVADAGELESRGKEKRPTPTTAVDAHDDPTPAIRADEQSDDEYQSEDVDEEDDDDEDEDEEPRLKYGSLTKSVGALYRNGDATSASLSSGDKMIVGTHNGNLHVYAVPSFQRLRVYRAHSASVTSISLSPFPLPPPEISTILNGQPIATDSSNPPSQAQHQGLPHTSSNSLYIATSSIDGNVCIASLIDQKDVLLRNFGRPVQSVALSPRYKNDRTYISGGLAGSLVRTVGGRIGTSSNSTLAGGTAQASSWLGSFGLGGLTGNNGTDTVLHSGEGAISTIKWSLSGRLIVWVNEEGIKFMRSSLDLDSSESELAWTRIGHIDRPNLPGWEEMASVWKARVEWVDENTIEREFDPNSPSMENGHGNKPDMEKLVIGWGGTIWIINVFPGRLEQSKKIGETKVVEIATKFRMDCLISGVSLYTPNQLLVLSYIIPDNRDSKSQTKQAGPGRGIRHRQNGLQPELRLIDINSLEELSTDTLNFRRFESLSASDYHLGVLPPFQLPSASTAQKGTLESIRVGLLDATLYPVRLFSSATSVRSSASSGDKTSSVNVEGSFGNPAAFRDRQARELAMSAAKGVKIFLHSPYDCVMAVKRGFEDRLTWLVSHERYEEAWDLIDRHPEIVTTPGDDSGTATPTQRQGSLAEFFQDDTASSIRVKRELESSGPEKEKRRISERWLEQLVGDGKWDKAGQVCEKVLNTTDAWEKWVWVFAKNSFFDEIVQHIPTDLHPPLPSLIYEVFLGHYVSRDRARFQRLLELWPSNLFEISSVTIAIEDQLKTPTAAEGTEDWRILTSCIAQLFLADGHYREALQRYIRLQDAETAMKLIGEHHLLDAVVDDIPGFVLIRIPRKSLRSLPAEELEEAASEPLNLLVRDAANGIVRPEAVVSQLQAADLDLFLYFYFRRLWTGEAAASATEKRATRMRGHHRTDAAEKLAADEGRALIDSFSDTVVELFADYDRQLLMEFLKSNTAYSYSAASSICERRHFTHELIYLFSKTGQTKRALQLILSDLKDISHAISFAKSQDDADLWDDLLSYSMDKPEYIRSLLIEGGTSIDPIKLVRRIPSGLEIEGLREGLTRLIREHDIQASISQGVAKVLIGEVAGRMNKLRDGQRRGIKFELATDAGEGVGQAGRCAGCQKPFIEQEQESLVGFACGHIYHVSHLQENRSDDERPPIAHPQEDNSPFFSRTVGLKVTNARLLRDKVGAGCRICASSTAAVEQ